MQGTSGRLRCLLQPWSLLVPCRAWVPAVEIAVVVFMLSRHLYLPLYEQYYYFSYGSDILKNTSFDFYNKGRTFCMSSDLLDNYTGNTDIYKRDESFSVRLVLYGQIANSIPSILTTVLFGPLTDRFGRKIGLLFPSIGATLQGIFSIFIISYSLDPYYFILANFVSGLFGGYTCILASSFSYIADVSSPRWRSLRIGIVEAAIAYGGGAGQFIGGYWLHKINCDFIPPLSLYAGCNLFIVVYVLLLVPESLDRSEREKLCCKNPRGIKAYSQGLKLFCGSLSPSATWKLYVATITMCVAVVNIYGAMLVDVYFFKSVKFEFNSLQIGIYQSVKSASQGSASLFLVGVLVILSVSDVWIVLIGILCNCGCNMLLGFSKKTWQIYAIGAAKGIEGVTFAGAQGLMSKLVKPEQQGILFSIIGSMGALASLAASTLSLIFPLTLQKNMRPGMTYIFMAVLAGMLLPLVLSLFLFKKKDLAMNGVDTSRARLREDSESESSEEEYKPLLTKSWTSNKAYGFNT